MPSRRQFLRVAGGAVFGGSVAGCTAADEPTTTRSVASLSVTSSAFADGEAIPVRYTADGADISPPLSFSGVPDGTESLAVVVDDPDAPGGTFTHWLLWGLPANRREIREDVPQREQVAVLGGARQGSNDFGTLGYRGPRPPADDGPHTYRFTVLALDRGLTIAPGADRGAFDDAVADAVLARGRLTGEYER